VEIFPRNVNNVESCSFRVNTRIAVVAFSILRSSVCVLWRWKS